MARDANDDLHTSHRRKKVHLVVAGASQWGQYACERVLHRVPANGGQVTLIVARRFEQLFNESPPTITAWARHPSLQACIDSLREDGQPIDYVFDDHLHHLAAELLQQREEYLRLGYVVTGAEEHYPYAKVLATICDRVLVEKPISKLIGDVHRQGRFPNLAKEFPHGRLFSCEHYSFRKGYNDVEAEGRLEKFVKCHSSHGALLYEFRFLEKAEPEELAGRAGAMQDGSILDVAVTHGLGPLSHILRILRNQSAQPANDDLHKSIVWCEVLAMQAREQESRESPLLAPVLAETAVRLTGTYSGTDVNFKLVLESGKGVSQSERYFRIVCPNCPDNNGANGEDAAVFLGVSLGAAGYTADAVDVDGGWQADRLAETSPEAENAQAAMLEAFIDEPDDPRFIPIEEACQIVQLGIEAQALAFLGRRDPYTVGTKFRWNKHTESGKCCKKRHEALKRLCDRSGPGQSLDTIKKSLGLDTLANSQPEESQGAYYRVMSILGPEGFGNTDVAEMLHSTLSDDADLVQLLHVRRDEEWCLGHGSGESTVNRLMRDLTNAIGLRSATTEDPTQDLVKRIVECREELRTRPRVLILNGVDRLGNKSWADLNRLLNQLPETHRLILITNRGDRAGGWVVRTEEINESQSGSTPAPSSSGMAANRHCRELKCALSGVVSEEAVTQLFDMINRLSIGNITVKRQLCSWIRNVVLPEFAQQEVDTDIYRALLHALASIAAPRTITPNPENLLNRISLACLGALPSAQRQAVTVLARLPDGVPTDSVRAAFPGLTAKMKEQGPLQSLFLHTARRSNQREGEGELVLFPHVRKAVVAAAHRGEEPWRRLQLELADRRLLLSLTTADKAERESVAQLDRLLALSERGENKLEHLDLDRSPFEELVLRSAERMEVGLRGGLPISSWHLRLLSVREKTNLGMSARSLILSIHAWSEIGKATSPVTLNRIMTRLAGACDVADGYHDWVAACDELWNESPRTNRRETERGKKLKQREASVHRNLVTSEVVRVFTWNDLFRLKKLPSFQFRRNDRIESSAMRIYEYLGDRLSCSGLDDSDALLIVILALYFLKHGTEEMHEGVTTRHGAAIQGNWFQSLTGEARRLWYSILLHKRALSVKHEKADIWPDLYRLNAALMYCRLGEVSHRNREHCRGKALAHFEKVRPFGRRDPYYKLSKAHMITEGVIVIAEEENKKAQSRLLANGMEYPMEHACAVELAREAMEGYRLLGHDYFVELAKAYVEFLELKAQQPPDPLPPEKPRSPPE